MDFEYIGNASLVARQLLPWAIGLAVLGLAVLIYSQVKDKSHIYLIFSLALIAIGGYMYFQSSELKGAYRDWVIRVDGDLISWQSPSDQVDPSFEAIVSDIEYIDEAAEPNASDSRPVYRLIMKNGDVIKLNPISGVDLHSFTQHLVSRGLEIRATEKYRKPVEKRNR
ncbi:MAG: hypothetical protein AAF402_08400 [Pseudomonadota bacterium]